MKNSFLDALGADGPAADRVGKMDLYGRFVGSWDLDVKHVAEDGAVLLREGEWHFGWALEGRYPGRLDRAAARGCAPRQCGRERQLLRHDLKGLRSRYRRLADTVDRPGDSQLLADDWPR
jgi:hypothetical protein